MRKTAITVIGGVLVLLGLILLIVPGPAFVLLIPGFFILSLEYPSAKKWLKKCQIIMRDSARWTDRQIAKMRSYRYR